MTPKERAAMQQALGALEQLGYGDSYAAIDLREALEEQAHDLYTNDDKDRPAVICDRNGEVVLSLCKRCGRGESDLSEPCIAEQAEQEPVAWMGAHDNTDLYYRKPPQVDVVPLYAAPVCTVDLTDDELDFLWCSNGFDPMDFARAIIAAFKEKNQ